MHLEIPLGSDQDFIGLISDLLGSVRPLAEQHKVSLETLGDFGTLPDKIQAEIAASNTVVGFVPLVAVWSRKPTDGRERGQNRALSTKKRSMMRRRDAGIHA
jgi:hypothetical protein